MALVQTELVGVAEAAEYFGVSSQAVSHWSRRHSNFPAPAVQLKMGPVYRLSELVKWVAERNDDGSDPIVYEGAEPDAITTIDIQDPAFDDLMDGGPPHPLSVVFAEAVNQAKFGKGERHGGDSVPFLEQPWAHYAKLHGRGFLTGQAVKKLEEAASKREGEPFVTEVLGALVYAAMAVICERGEL